MRTEKELFELMLRHQDLFRTGLCVWINMLYYNDIINDDEERLLIDYLDKNKPVGAKNYWWEIGEFQPRLDWINQQIEKL